VLCSLATARFSGLFTRVEMAQSGASVLYICETTIGMGTVSAGQRGDAFRYWGSPMIKGNAGKRDGCAEVLGCNGAVEQLREVKRPGFWR
jgi:hypothetical protein